MIGFPTLVLGQRGANERIRVGLVGLGGRMRSHIGSLAALGFTAATSATASVTPLGFVREQAIAELRYDSLEDFATVLTDVLNKIRACRQGIESENQEYDPAEKGSHRHRPGQARRAPRAPQAATAASSAADPVPEPEPRS